jgi:hypothetical protein
MNDGLTEAYSVTRKYMLPSHWFGFRNLYLSLAINDVNSRRKKGTGCAERVQEINKGGNERRT